MFLFACPQTPSNYACHWDAQLWSFRPWMPFDRYDKYANLWLFIQVEPTGSFWSSSNLDAYTKTLHPWAGSHKETLWRLWVRASLLREVAVCVCMGMFQAGLAVFQEFGPKRLLLGKNWMGFASDLARGVCLFLVWRRQTMDYILSSVTPSMSVDFSQPVLFLLLQLPKCITFCWSRRFHSISVSWLKNTSSPSTSWFKDNRELSTAQHGRPDASQG